MTVTVPGTARDSTHLVRLPSVKGPSLGILAFAVSLFFSFLFFLFLACRVS